MSKELEEMKKRYKAGLLNRNLKGEFLDYLTEIDCTSPCERLPDPYQRHLDRPSSMEEQRLQKEAEDELLKDGKEWWLKIDCDPAYQNEVERKLNEK